MFTTSRRDDILSAAVARGCAWPGQNLGNEQLMIFRDAAYVPAGSDFPWPGLGIASDDAGYALTVHTA